MTHDAEKQRDGESKEERLDDTVLGGWLKKGWVGLQADIPLWQDCLLRRPAGHPYSRKAASA